MNLDPGYWVWFKRENRAQPIVTESIFALVGWSNLALFPRSLSLPPTFPQVTDKWMEHKIPSPWNIAWWRNNLVSGRVGRESRSHPQNIIANRMSGQSCPSISKMKRNVTETMQIYWRKKKEEERKKGGREEGTCKYKTKNSSKKKTWLKREEEIPYCYFIPATNKNINLNKARAPNKRIKTIEWDFLNGDWRTKETNWEPKQQYYGTTNNLGQQRKNWSWVENWIDEIKVFHYN